MAVNLQTKDAARAIGRELLAIEPDDAIRKAKRQAVGAESISFDEAARRQGRFLLKKLKENAKEKGVTWPRTTGIDCMGELLMELALFVGKNGVWREAFGYGESADVSMVAESYQEATGMSDEEMIDILTTFVNERTTAEEFRVWLWS